VWNAEVSALKDRHPDRRIVVRPEGTDAGLHSRELLYCMYEEG